MNFRGSAYAYSAFILLLFVAGCGEQPERQSEAEEKQPVEAELPQEIVEPEPLLLPLPEPLTEPEINPYEEFEKALGRLLQYQVATYSLKEELSAATRDVNKERAFLRSAIQALSKDPLPEEGLLHPRNRLKNTKEKIAKYEASGDKEKAQEQHRIADEQEIWLKVLSLPDPKEREDFKVELEERLKKAEESYGEIAAPYTREIASIQKNYESVERVIKEDVLQFFLIPEAIEPVIKLGSFSYKDFRDWGAIKWTGPDRRQAFSAFVYFRYPKQTGELDGLFLDQYPCTNYTNWTIHVHVGHFELRVMVHHEDYKTKEGVAEIVPLLFDLEAIAKLTPSMASE